jgi:hypothetical protein
MTYPDLWFCRKEKFGFNTTEGETFNRPGCMTYYLSLYSTPKVKTQSNGRQTEN